MVKKEKSRDWIDYLNTILLLFYVLLTAGLLCVAYTKGTEIQVSLNEIIHTLEPKEIRISDNLVLIDRFNNTYRLSNGSLIAQSVVVPSGYITVSENYTIIASEEIRKSFSDRFQ